MIVLESVDSTNNYLLERKELLDTQFFTVWALAQTAGRGREQRKWYSRKGADLTFSMVYKTDLGSEAIPAITLYTGLILFEVLSKYTFGGLSLKWPNDVCFGKKKLAGILCEAYQDEQRKAIVIGMGINIKKGEFNDEIKDSAVSLSDICEYNADMDYMVFLITSALKRKLPEYVYPLSEEFCEKWIKAANDNLEVIINIDGEELKAHIEGIDSSGFLNVKDSKGVLHEGYKGEVHYVDNA
jgi:BirA family biotin operon repressor/biotin-[acetyl-CoA-carboxylase] ligase